MLKFFLITAIACFGSHLVFAQLPGGGIPGGINRKQYNVGHFYGKVVDAKTGKGIGFATVRLFHDAYDSASHSMKNMLVNGALTEDNGDFSMENLPVFGNFALKISALGYDSVSNMISFGLKLGQQNMQQMMSAVDKDLGNIQLNASAVQLAGVTVTGDEPAFKLELDKKVYTVDKNSIATGGTAEDVLKNIPSVNVDLDGNVTLRNAAPQIFVDGRPTTLTIDQIPADAIDKVELITNPSAKYDASGGQAGILNIVLKKNKRIGYNGDARVGVDERGKINAGGDINIRQNKVNVFASGNFNERKSIGYGANSRYSYFEEPYTNIFQHDTLTQTNHFGFASLGMDYFANNRNTFSLSGNYVKGQFSPFDNIYTTTDSLFQTGTTSSNSIETSNSERSFRNLGGTFSYKHLYPKDDKTWTADLNYNRAKSNNSSLYNTQYYDQSDLPTGPPGLQTQTGNSLTEFMTAQSDYSNPITDKMKVEAGVRAAVRHFDSQNFDSVFDYTSGRYMQAENLNNYNYWDQVYAAYGTFSNKLKNWQYELGLRIESSYYEGQLVDQNKIYNNNFPFSPFPSAFITYQINKKSNVQLSYTRRIDRPSFFQLIPYTDYTDTLNLQRGNPNLKPQFTNSLEASYQINFDKNNSLLFSGYFKYTTNLITRYQVLEFDSVLGHSTIINTYENANSSTNGGIEITSTNSFGKWFSMNADVNLYDSKIDGSNIETGLSNQQFSFFARVNTTFKLPKNFQIQLSGDYTSRTAVPQSGGGSGGGGNGGGGGGFGGGHGGFFGSAPATIQGYVEPIYGMDLGIRKDFLKNKSLSLTLNATDILKTRVYTTVYNTAYYDQTTSRKRDPLFFRLNASYRFGKFDTSLFKRKTQQNSNDIMQDVPQQ